MSAVPLTALKASTIVLNWLQAATGSQWRSQSRGVTWESLGSLLKTQNTEACITTNRLSTTLLFGPSLIVVSAILMSESHYTTVSTLP